MLFTPLRATQRTRQGANSFAVLCSTLLPDTCISSLLEAALSGNEEQKPLECTLRPELSVLVDLALGSSKEPANSLWINMQDYAISKGLQTPPTLEFPLIYCQRRRRAMLMVFLCVFWFWLQTGTMRLSVTSRCWTPSQDLCLQPC